MRLPRAVRAVDGQRAAVRAELHAIVDRLVDDWPAIEHWSAFAVPMSGGERRGSSTSDPTGSMVVALSEDAAHQWLDRFEVLRREVRQLDGERAALRPAKATRGRANTVDVCARCRQPNPKMKRIDGQPHCATSCYFVVWRAGRAEPKDGDLLAPVTVHPSATVQPGETCR